MIYNIIDKLNKNNFIKFASQKEKETADIIPDHLGVPNSNLRWVKVAKKQY